ncbi:MAG: ankyrin repeat domain-containing protein [Nitrososphaerota archaeon]|nr:ankyrin repeat domain-containing protein [Nitrososphaerota archaeon]
MMSENLFKAIRQGDSSKIERMLNKNGSLANSKDSSGMTPVVIATYYGQPKIAQIIIEHGAKLDLFEAAMTGQLEIVKQIAAKDQSSINSYSKDGYTALHLAAFFGHLDVAKFLIQSGAKIDIASTNAMKVTPLHSAAARNQLEISELLLSSGANANAKQDGDFTPLHAAAQNGSIEMAQLLIRHGADVNAKTKEGKRPLDMIREEGRESGPKDKRDAVAIFLVENGDL